jgi:hypothetical protein
LSRHLFRCLVATGLVIACFVAAGPAWADDGVHSGRLTVTPHEVNFGHQAVGSPTNPVTITIHNAGTTTVTFDHLSLEVIKGEAGTFTELNQLLKAVLCDGDAGTLLPQDSCLLFVQFTPASAGAKHARLEVSFTLARSDDQSQHGHDQGGTTVELDVNLRGVGVSSA